MRSSVVLFLPLLIPQLFVPAPVGSSATSLLTCAHLATEAERSNCVDRILGDGSLGRDELAALQDVVQEMPASVLEVAMRRADPPGAEASAGPARAAWLDLQGQALFALGRFDEAAARFAEALSIDDGTLRLRWISPEEGERWSASLDPGGGRLEWAARSLASAGRSAEARDPLGRALALGAGGWAEQAWSAIGAGPPPGRSERPDPLSARNWFKPVPDYEVDLAGGGRFSLREDSRGRVMILSFWATWCQPCLLELPRLQELYESERENGLEVLGINAGESMQIAVPFARGLELTFPIARGRSDLHEAFDTSRLPLTAVVDRWGAVRGRWAGFEPGDDERLASMTRRLLAEKSPPSREVGEILLGRDLLEIAWLRPGPGSVDGLAVVPRGAGLAGVLVSAARSLVLYGNEGETLESWVGDSPMGDLRVSPPAEDGLVEVLAFRAGSPAVVSIDLPSGDRHAWSAPAPVFDAQVIGPPLPERGAPVLLATMRGLWRGARGDDSVAPVAAVENGVSAVEPVTLGAARGLAALEFGGRILWLGSGLESERQTSASAGSWVLVGGAGHVPGVGVAPSGLRAAAAGRFLDRPGAQLALATESGQLVLLSLETGEALFRARWSGISALASGNLFGDDRDELVVGAGGDVGVLRALPN